MGKGMATLAAFCGMDWSHMPHIPPPSPFLRNTLPPTRVPVTIVALIAMVPNKLTSEGL